MIVKTSYLEDEDYCIVETWCESDIIGTSEGGAVLQLPDRMNVARSLEALCDIIDITFTVRGK